MRVFIETTCCREKLYYLLVDVYGSRAQAARLRLSRAEVDVGSHTFFTPTLSSQAASSPQKFYEIGCLENYFHVICFKFG